MTKVMVSGTFDLIHPGHKYFLNQAKKYGDKLFVVIARDETVRRVKGYYPKNTEEKRLKKIKELPMVDTAILGHRDDKHKILGEIKPDVICLGYDQHTFTIDLKLSLKKKGLETKVVRIDSYHPEKYKSSKLK